MKRRTLLRGVPAAGALALAGCLTAGSGGQATDTAGATDGTEDTDSPSETERDAPADTVSEPDDGSDTPSDAPTDGGGDTPTDATDDPSATPSGVAESSLEVQESGCGGQTDDASVAFDDAGETVTVTGIIWGNDACYTAVLSDVRLDGGSLTVSVAAESDGGTDVGCAQCITEIAYEVAVALEAGRPHEVTVVHARGGEDTKVTSVER